MDKPYISVQEMLDDIAPDFAETYRKNTQQPIQRFFHWIGIVLIVVKLRCLKLFGK